MEIFKQLEKLGYKHYVDLTIEELDKLPIDNIERRIECSLIIDWFREKYNIHISLLPHNDVEFGIRIRYNKSTLIHGGYKTYEEAREQSIIKAIEILEENDNLQR